MDDRINKAIDEAEAEGRDPFLAGIMAKRAERSKAMTKPIFQRRHYEAIADEIKFLSETRVGISSRIVAYRFADRFAADNPRFDRGRFLAACGVEQ